MKFDDTITIGTIIQTVVLAGVFIRLYGDFTEIKIKVHAMWVVFMREHGDRHEDHFLQMGSRTKLGK